MRNSQITQSAHFTQTTQTAQTTQTTQFAFDNLEYALNLFERMFEFATLGVGKVDKCREEE